MNLNRDFSVEESKMPANTKKYSTFLFMNETYIETTLRFHITTIRIDKINKIIGNSF